MGEYRMIKGKGGDANGSVVYGVVNFCKINIRQYPWESGNENIKKEKDQCFLLHPHGRL